MGMRGDSYSTDSRWLPLLFGTWYFHARVIWILFLGSLWQLNLQLPYIMEEGEKGEGILW